MDRCRRRRRAPPELSAPSTPADVRVGIEKPGHGDEIRESVGGNPAAAISNQRKTVEALGSFELVAQVDPSISYTAQLATLWSRRRLSTRRRASPVAGADRHQVGHRLRLRRGLRPVHPGGREPSSGVGRHRGLGALLGLGQRLALRREVTTQEGIATPLDVLDKPTLDDLFEVISRGSRVSLDTVRRRANGALYLRPPGAEVAVLLEERLGGPTR